MKNYRKKRHFHTTPEPQGSVRKKSHDTLIFVVQEHHASHLHYDLRLEMQGVLKSWAVPKGPPMGAQEKRLAIQVEDHPFEYKDFEGIIPKGNYGAGKVTIWDKGTYSLLNPGGLNKGHFSFILHGKKLQGKFTLIKLKNGKDNQWLLIKKATSLPKTLKKIPKNLTPMLAYLTNKPFNRKGWIFEIKWDGYRTLAYLDHKKVTLYSRSHKDYSEIFKPITQELSKINISAILDGEIVALDKEGYAHFQWLQQFQKHNQGDLVYMVFDLLWLNGSDLRSLPLSKRQILLAKSLPTMAHVRICEHIRTQGKAFFKAATEHGLEGIIAKEASSQYLSGKRSKSWLKIKVKQRQQAIITGYTAPRGSRRHIGSLILGLYKNKKLIYIGHTAGRLTENDLEHLKEKLLPLATKSSPFKDPPKTNAPVTWVKPILRCEVIFTEWTQKGLLRQPIFIKLCNEHSTSSEEKIISLNQHSVKLTHLNKLYWPQNGYTKNDLIEYYREVAPYILPYLKNRPQNLHRFPNGITKEHFFQKNIETFPAWVKTKVFYSTHNHHEVRYLICQNEATLIYLANLGCIEMNPWLSRIQSPDRPDYCVIDLDPEDIAFSAVIKTANVIRRLLDKTSTPSFCKTSGKRGLHIYIPLDTSYDFLMSRQLGETLASVVHAQLPHMTSLERSPTKRQGKVYIDYLQNAPHQTIVAPYSVRPTPGATVSTPLKWSEVNSRLNPEKFTIKNIMKRLDKYGDVWKATIKNIDA